MILLGAESTSVLIITFNDCKVPWEIVMKKLARLHFHRKLSFPIHSVRITEIYLNTQGAELIV